MVDLKRLRAHPDNKTKRAMQRDCEQAADELEVLRKDAERYRWLRNEVKNGHDVERLFIPALGFAIHDLDARIDREIALDAKCADVGAA